MLLEHAWGRVLGPLPGSGASAWTCEIVPLRSGPLRSRLRVTHRVPRLPPGPLRDTELTLHPMFRVNFHAPCLRDAVTRETDLPTVEVLPLPPPPLDVPVFAGLCGSWHAEVEASQERVVCGEPFLLTLHLRGDGSALLLRPPELDTRIIRLSHAAMEREKAPGEAVLRWQAVALGVPLHPPLLRFSTFDGTAYVPHALPLPVHVEAASGSWNRGAALPTALSSLHGLDQGRPGRPVPHGRAAAGLLLAAMLADFVLQRQARRRELARSLAGRRRAALDRLRTRLPDPGADLGAVLEDIRLAFGLSPGTTVTEAAAVLDSCLPELARLLRQAETGRFRRRRDSLDGIRPGVRSALSAILLLLTAATGPAREGALDGASDPTALAREAWLRGDHAAAYRLWHDLRERLGDHPALLLNLGNAAWFAGRRAETLALYERALRLQPRNRPAREAVGWLRQEILGTRQGQALAYPLPLRDALRPDEWLCLAALCLLLGAVAAGALRLRGRRYAAVRTSAAALALVGLCLAFTQWVGPYRPGSLVRVSWDALLRDAPGAVAEGPVRVGQGTRVVLLERTGAWAFVCTGNANGWLPAEWLLDVW
ncbi:MAG: hypothetical protein JXR77_18705 [Lentisphaeria bacterium]|nr:hypothetical protein [Lentisphaeria bacterium]